MSSSDLVGKGVLADAKDAWDVLEAQGWFESRFLRGYVPVRAESVRRLREAVETMRSPEWNWNDELFDDLEWATHVGAECVPETPQFLPILCTFVILAVLADPPLNDCTDEACEAALVSAAQVMHHGSDLHLQELAQWMRCMLRLYEGDAWPIVAFLLAIEATLVRRLVAENGFGPRSTHVRIAESIESEMRRVVTDSYYLTEWLTTVEMKH